MRRKPASADLCHVYESTNLKTSANLAKIAMPLNHKLAKWRKKRTNEIFRERGSQNGMSKIIAKRNRSYSKSNQLNHSVTFELEWKKKMKDLFRNFKSWPCFNIKFNAGYTYITFGYVVCSSHYIFSLWAFENGLKNGIPSLARSNVRWDDQQNSYSKKSTDRSIQK